MKILITGATGFIGTELMRYLSKKKYNVHGISSQKSKTTKILTISLLDKKLLDQHFRKNTYDVVIHLAALIEHKNPLELYQINCQATLNILESCRLNNIKKFIFTSSQAVYGNSQYLPIDEEHPLQPTSNYGLTKLIAENITKLFHFSYKLNIFNLRLSSVYGINQPRERIISAMILHALKRKKMILHQYQNGFQLMDFIHVDDVCQAIELSCKSIQKSGIYNIASGKPITVQEIAKIISSITGFDMWEIRKVKNETNHFFYNTNKAKKYLRFRPKYLVNEKSIFQMIHNFENS